MLYVRKLASFNFYYYFIFCISNYYHIPKALRTLEFRLNGFLFHYFRKDVFTILLMTDHMRGISNLHEFWAKIMVTIYT